MLSLPVTNRPEGPPVYPKEPHFEKASAIKERAFGLVTLLACLTTVGSACALRDWRATHLPAEAMIEALDGEGPPRGGIPRPVFRRGLELTMVSEGWSARLYNDVARYCTIGFGHLVAKRPCDGSEPAEFRAGITKIKGEELLINDMTSARLTVTNSVTINLTDGQYAALCDFVFNVGTGNFQRSTLLKHVNAEQHDRVAAQFRRWILAGGKAWPGLRTRREREIEIYFDAVPVPRGVSPEDLDLAPIDIRVGERR